MLSFIFHVPSAPPLGLPDISTYPLHRAGNVPSKEAVAYDPISPQIDLKALYSILEIARRSYVLV